jgi:REP element-mobilizing transposase RayT
MGRGIERRNIVKYDTDREEFLGWLAKLLPHAQTACYAWVLMPNHAHLLLCPVY